MPGAIDPADPGSPEECPVAPNLSRRAHAGREVNHAVVSPGADPPEQPDPVGDSADLARYVPTNQVVFDRVEDSGAVKYTRGRHVAPAGVDVAEQRETRLRPMATYRPHRRQRHDHVAELTAAKHEKAPPATHGTGISAQLFVHRFDHHCLALGNAHSKHVERD